MIVPTHVVFSRPRLVGGHLQRGFLATDYPKTLQSQCDPNLWAIGFFIHAAFCPYFDPQVDLYFASETYSECPLPRIDVTDRDLTDENSFFPDPAVDKQYDLIFNATWMPVKRHELLIEALSFAQQAGRPLSCLWFGYHYCEDSHQRERQIRAAVKSLRLDVTFAETNFNVSVVNARYNSARVCLICSASEGGPRVMGEALLSGIPFIVTADTAGGAPQLICDRNGVVCQPTGASIAQAIWEVIDRPHQFQPRDWALEHICRSRTLQRLQQAVRQLSDVGPVPINWQEITFKGYDWECRRQEARAAERGLDRQKD